MCEAIFYVIAFRSGDLTNINEDLTFLQLLQTGHLNPLRVFLRVATAVAGVTRAHCHTILERNAQHELATVHQNEMMMPEETLDTDPHLLKKSGAFITDFYQPCGDNNDKENAITEHECNKIAKLAKLRGAKSRHALI